MISFLKKNGIHLSNGVLLICILIYLAFFNRNTKDTDQDTRPLPIYTYDTPVVHIHVSPPVIPAPLITIHNAVPLDVDTAAILKMYYTDNYYRNFWRDTVAGVELTVEDTIGENKLKWFKYGLKNLRPISATCPELPKPRNKVYYGLSTGFYNNEYVLGPVFLFQGKQERIYSLDFNVMNGFKEVDVRIGLIQKLSFRGKR